MKFLLKPFFIRYSFLIFIGLAFFQITKAQSETSDVYSIDDSENSIFASDPVFSTSEDLTTVYAPSTRQYAPVVPEEPGDTCIPVPDGYWILISLLLIYLGFKIYLKKSVEKLNT